MISANWPRLRVRHLMTSPAVTIHAGATIRLAAHEMLTRHIHRLVVIADDGTPHRGRDATRPPAFDIRGSGRPDQVNGSSVEHDSRSRSSARTARWRQFRQSSNRVCPPAASGQATIASLTSRRTPRQTTHSGPGPGEPWPDLVIRPGSRAKNGSVRAPRGIRQEGPSPRTSGNGCPIRIPWSTSTAQGQKSRSAWAVRHRRSLPRITVDAPRFRRAGVAEPPRRQ